MIKMLEKWKDNHYRLTIVLIGFIALFCLGYQWMATMNKPEETHPPTEPLPQKIPKDYNPGDSLLDLKIERDRERSQDIESMKNLLDKAGLTDKTRQEAEGELWRLTEAVAKEHQLENLLKAKGIHNCLVTIGQDLVTIVMEGKIQADQARSIGETAAEACSFRLDQVRIVERLE